MIDSNTVSSKEGKNQESLLSVLTCSLLSAVCYTLPQEEDKKKKNFAASVFKGIQITLPRCVISQLILQKNKINGLKMMFLQKDYLSLGQCLT